MIWRVQRHALLRARQRIGKHVTNADIDIGCSTATPSTKDRWNTTICGQLCALVVKRDDDGALAVVTIIPTVQGGMS